MEYELRSTTWPLQDAKARFSELVQECLAGGAQTVTRHGKPAVAIVPWDTWQRLSSRKGSLSEFLASAPRAVLDVQRLRSGERAVDL